MYSIEEESEYMYSERKLSPPPPIFCTVSGVRAEKLPLLPVCLTSRDNPGNMISLSVYNSSFGMF